MVIGRVGRSVVVALLFATAGVVTPARPAHADPPIPIHLIRSPPGWTLHAASNDGRYVHSSGHVTDTHTHRSTAVDQPIDGPTAVGDDGTVYSVRDWLLWVGAPGQDATSVAVSFPPDWFPTGVRAADPDRGRVVISAANGNLGRVRVFLVDLTTGEAITDTDLGLNTTNWNSSTTWFLDDGSIVVSEYGAGLDLGSAKYAIWAPDLSSVTTIEPPPEHASIHGPFMVDRALEYIWFATDQGGIVDGVGAGPPRVYRRHIATGATVAAPIDVQTAAWTAPLAGGDLLLGIDLPPGPSWNHQLFRWDGTSTAIEQLTVGFDGAEPNGTVVDVAPPTGSGVITFTSRASNLTEAIPAKRGTYLYQITTEDRPPTPPPPPHPVPPEPPAPPEARLTEPQAATEPPAPVVAGETYCVPAVGARPGDFVGVNITPVNALTRGNGALHSSDDDPPATANVNFSAGSVDPNVAFAEVGLDRSVCFTNSRHGPVDVVIDALVVADGEVFRPPSDAGAVRIADTRIGLGGRTLAPAETRCVEAAGANGGEFAGINITPVNALTRGNGALHSSDDEPPATANVNFAARSVDPNLAFSRVGADGEVCFSNSTHGPVDLVMDLLLVAAPDTFVSPTDEGAVRIADTRAGVGARRLAADDTRCFATRGAHPGDWIGLNLTPVDAITSGNGAAHSSDDEPPATANVNFRAGSVDPNLTLVAVGSAGRVCFSNSAHGPVDLVGDELFVAGADVFSAPTTDGAHRLTDTRVARHPVPGEPPPVEPPPAAPAPLVHIEAAGELQLRDASDDGRYVLLGNWRFQTGQVVDMVTSTAFDLEHQPGDRSIVGDDGTVYSLDAGSIIAEPIGGPPVAVPANLLDPWGVTKLFDVDPARRRMLVKGERGAGVYHAIFLIDLDTGIALSGGDPLPHVADRDSHAWFRTDGTFLTWAAPDYRVWDTTATASTTIERPAETEGSWGPWAIDPTATYVWFYSHAGGIVDDLEAGVHRLYRRTIATGATIVAPERAGGNNWLMPLADGTVIINNMYGEDPFGVFYWDGEATEIRRLDVRVDGSDPNGWSGRILPPREGAVVTFSTDATDLGPELLRSGRFGHAYQVDPTG